MKNDITPLEGIGRGPVTREEHMKWCKKRALEYCDLGDTQQAFASMASDLGKHEETKGHAAISLGMMLMINDQLSDLMKMREFINGFN